MYNLEQLEKFAGLMHAVDRVKRVARRPDEQERTNTAEHTFELVMMCWYIASTQNLDLDQAKIIKYALAHDVIEAYAGDTHVYDEEAKKSKVEREAKALVQLEEEFPEFTEFLETIHEYEERAAPEARFVYAVDKLVDPLNFSMEKTQSVWKEYDVSWDAFVDHKKDKIYQSPEVVPFWNLLLEKLQNKREFFFKE